MIKNKSISTLVITFLVFSFFFLALPEKGYSGVSMLPPTMGPIANVPTLSEWGLLSLAVVLGILGIGAFLVMRRKKVA